MATYFKLDKNGNLPDFSFKNTEYWFDHDIRHIKDSFRWCLKASIYIFIASSALMIIYGNNTGWNIINMLKFNLGTFIAFFLTLLFLRILLYKGYSVMGGLGLGYASQLDQKGPFVPKDFDDKKFENLKK